MKVLIATAQKQGFRKNDFCHAKEGEYVRFGSECDGESVDGKCGCRRSMVGFETHRATTTFTCAERPISKNEYTECYKKALKEGGWLEYYTDDQIKKDIDELISIANGCPIGLVLEKRGQKINSRG